MKKRILSFALTLLLTFALFPALPIPALAAGETHSVISLSSAHAMVIKTDGSLWGWGDNVRGVVGDTGTVWTGALGWGAELVPLTKWMDGVVTVSVCGVRTMVVKTDGSLWAWGSAGYGARGDGVQREGLSDVYPDITDTNIPVKVMDGVAAVSSSESFTMVIKTDGSLWAWGNDLQGQLGDGVVQRIHLKPVKVMDDVADVSAGHDGHTLALKTDGSLWAWGINYEGQLGIGSYETGFDEDNTNKTSTGRSLPVKIMDDVVKISAGNQFSMAVKKDGSLWGWGSNMYGRLGIGTFDKYDENTWFYPSPVKVMDGVADVSAGLTHTMAIKKDGSLWGWGWNFSDALGFHKDYPFDEEYEISPVKIMEGVAAVSSGDISTMVVKTDGSLWLWGKSAAINFNWSHGKPMDYASVKVMDGIAIPKSMTALESTKSVSTSEPIETASIWAATE